jgi:hypothetical protein
MPGVGQVAPGRQQCFDGLAVLVNGPVEVRPLPGDLDVGLAGEPPVARGVATGAGCLDESWGEPLHSAVDGDVVHGDAALS